LVDRLYAERYPIGIVPRALRRFALPARPDERLANARTARDNVVDGME
jgi:hypothetical protein